MTAERGLRLWRAVGRRLVAVLMLMGGAVALGGTDATAQVKTPDQIRIVFVTHGQANDVYWTVVKNGVEAAAKALGVKAEYEAPETFDVVRMARLIEAATASKPDGLVVSIPDAAALEAPVTAAKAAGIPVVVIDSGEDETAAWKLDLFVGGGSEYDNGVKAGRIMSEAGVKEGLCINHEVGNVSLDKRCEGFTEGLGEKGGTVEIVAVTMDPTDATRRVEAFMSAHPATNGVLTLGPTVGSPMLAMLEERGLLGRVKMGTFDLSAEMLDAIAAGKMLFAVDNQQFMMGYLPVVFLTTRAMYKTFPTSTVYTGPSFITKNDAGAVRDLSEKGFR